MSSRQSDPSRIDDRKINVLIADDSRVTRTLLVGLLESDPHLRVVGAVSNGQAALNFVQRQRPDVALIDIYMPGLDGFETTRQIMETCPVPIVICSAAVDATELATAFRSLEAGAVACIQKPRGSEHPDFAATAAHLIQTIKSMSEVKVVRRWARTRAVPAQPLDFRRAPTEIRLVGIGASTGGPPALQSVLCALPKDYPVPILIVQHIAQGFLLGLADWLNQTTGFKVHIGSHGAHPLAGHVYLAPDDFHMGIGHGDHIILTREEPENGLRPAVSFLFRSLAEACGAHAVGVLLTGMGVDGAAQLKLMRDKGAVTIAQDQESSVVHGMPGAAIALGGATHILSVDKIADALVGLANRKNGR